MAKNDHELAKDVDERMHAVALEVRDSLRAADLGVEIRCVQARVRLDVTCPACGETWPIELTVHSLGWTDCPRCAPPSHEQLLAPLAQDGERA